MRVIETLDGIVPGEFSSGSAVAIGKFDGIHLGHRTILANTRAVADREGLHAVVFTFANNPLSFLNPAACPRPLSSRGQQLEAFADEGIDDCVMVEFDASIASIPAEEFVERVLVAGLNAKHVVLGDDFRFGHRGAGDGALLREMGARLGFTVDVVGSVTDPVLGRVSSSRIREAVSGGDVGSAARMLGRPVEVRGEVVHGDARGRELGFPTANLGGGRTGGIEGLVPADGVYAGSALVAGREYTAAISVGNNPTFTPEGQSRVEAYLLDFAGDIYGERITVRFAERLRGTERFDSLDALVVQMRADVERTREILSVE